ncbi:hypothetical protein TanjilG_29127 [Lupinus angustifolius]|uniref:DUF4378 domain-containing protein n=1 Tax=Lupinus angustifolius TaxID=3871 RepID=A0A1J7HCQ7_LUPAN|nr:PREDICTED: uncharacterized protein LOC109361465 isoform X2 [Lupinus angustifolius]OIW00137.1 hypothetical protein TanjilG_29127 [Lupinus angustifolius]
MGAEKVGTKSEGGVFRLFDWTSKSRKKLFASKSDFPESSKQRRKIDDSLTMKHSYLMREDEDEIGVRASIRGSNDHSYASSVTDDEICGTRTPSVVARLMGLESVPFSGVPDPHSTPYFDSRSLREAQYCRTNLNCQHDHEIPYSGRLLEKDEGSSRNSMGPKLHKNFSRPIEKFQAEVMPPKSAKSIPVTHHKLLSPIKSPGFVPTNNAAYVMEAAARIIKYGPQVTTKVKSPSVASSTVSLRVRDLKEKVKGSPNGPSVETSSLASRVGDHSEKQEISHRTCRLTETSQRSVESNPAKYSKGQSLNKSRERSISSLTEAEEDSSLKDKGKSISLAIQAKMNVQRREGLCLSGGESLADRKENFDITTKLPQKENIQRSMHKKSCGQNASGVLKQNNQKQNCTIDKDKLPSKPLVAGSNNRKVQSVDSSYGSGKSSGGKSIAKSKGGPKNSAIQVKDGEKETLYTRTNNFSIEKRSADRNWNDSVDSLFIDKTVKHAHSNLLSDKHYSCTGEVKKRDIDVVSFTFTTPLTRKTSGFEKSGQTGLKSNGSLNQHNKRVLLETGSTRSPVGYNEAGGGDALGILLEQKLKELTYGCETSSGDSSKARPPSSTASKSNGLVPTMNSVNLIRQLQQKKDQNMLFADAVCSSRESDISFTGLLELQSKHRLWVDEMKECKSNPEEAKSFNCRQPSPISVLEPSFSTESCDSLFRTDAATSSEGSKLCLSSQPREVLDYNFSRKSHIAEADAELSDSACSSLTRTMVKKHTCAFSLKNTERSSTWELDYVNDILCHVELMYTDFALGRAREIINPHLFNLLESRKGSDSGEFRTRRKVIFDCVSECLDLRCRRYVGGGYKMWTKGIAMVRRNEWLAREVYKEISSWKGVEDSMVDDLVDRDMSSQHGRWVDFEVDTFALGAEVVDQIFNSLVDDVVSEILQLQQVKDCDVMAMRL